MNILKLIGVITLSIIVLSACGGDSSGNQNQGKSVNNKTTNHKNGKQSSSLNGSDQDNTYEEGSTGKKKSTTKGFNNQLTLKMGATGTVKSNINKYKITLESAKTKKSVDGTASQSGQFVMVEISIKNIGENKMEAGDVAQTLELKDDLRGSGSGDFANQFKGINELKGSIAPGQTVKGEALFDVFKAKKYYLVDGSGLADQGAGLQNKVIWTFKASEAQ